jgi:hypothetical protein
MYEFLRWLIERVGKFPRDQRFLLGDRIENAGLDVLLLLVEAVYSRDKRGVLRRANLELEKLRWLIRLAQDSRLLSVSQYEYAAKQMTDVGAQIGGWIKQQTPP